MPFNFGAEEREAVRAAEESAALAVAEAETFITQKLQTKVGPTLHAPPDVATAGTRAPPREPPRARCPYAACFWMTRRRTPRRRGSAR